MLLPTLGTKMNDTINIEQAKIEHSQVFARQVVAIIDQKNGVVNERLNKLEAEKNAAIEVVSSDITATDAAENQTTVQVIGVDSSVQTIFVPVSIFTEESINLVEVDNNQNLGLLSNGLSALSQQLGNLEFLNGG